ncbi:Ubiquitin-60S ribosomal protein [Dirofilaria immitis]
MKLYVKRVNAKSSVFTITVDSKDTVASLKERIGGVLDLFPDSVRLLHQGHPLSKSQTHGSSFFLLQLDLSSRRNIKSVWQRRLKASVWKSWNVMRNSGTNIFLDVKNTCYWFS